MELNVRNLHSVSKAKENLKAFREVKIIESTSRFILYEQSRLYCDFLQYSDNEICNQRGQEVNLSTEACDEQRLNNGNAVIETIVLGESCRAHCGNSRMPACVLEHWAISKVQSNTFPRDVQPGTFTIVAEAIRKFIAESQLTHWITYPTISIPSSKRFKLTHRIFYNGQSRVTRLGRTTLIDTCDLTLAINDLYNSNLRDMPLSSEVVFGLITDDSNSKHTFPPIYVDSNSALLVSVSVPAQFPRETPSCPLCRSSEHSPVKSPSISPPCKKPTHVDGVIAQFDSMQVERATNQSSSSTGANVGGGCKRDHHKLLLLRPNPSEGTGLRRRNASSTSSTAYFDFDSSSTTAFHRRTGLPLRSSPAPLKRSVSGRFDYDASLKYSHSNCNRTIHMPIEPRSAGELIGGGSSEDSSTSHVTSSPPPHQATPPNASPTDSPHSIKRCRRPNSLRLSTDITNMLTGDLVASAPTSTARPKSDEDAVKFSLAQSPSSRNLLVNFEESLLSGRISPAGQIQGFAIKLGASGSFFPPHVRLSLETSFYDLADDCAPSPFLGVAELHHRSLHSRKGYRIPKKGSVQITLFNPNGSVINIFIIPHDLEDMPTNSQTFLRQRTVYVPIASSPTISSSSPSFLASSAHHLRYLVHLRLHTTGSGKLYLHTNVRLIFAREKSSLNHSSGDYELRSFVDQPSNPRYSVKRLTSASK